MGHLLTFIASYKPRQIFELRMLKSRSAAFWRESASMADLESAANGVAARVRSKRSQIASTGNSANQVKRRKQTMSRNLGESNNVNSVADSGKKERAAGAGRSVKKGQSVNRGQSQSCHQCRQSILSAKGMQEVKEGKRRAKCHTCTRFWCGSCLLNRYGVSLEEAEDCKWSCPFCCKSCNCSLCRRKAGMLATGILTPLAKTSGFGSVSDYLTKSTDEIATCLQWAAQKGTVSDTPGKEEKRQRQYKGGKSADERRSPLRRSSAPACVREEAKITVKVMKSPRSPDSPDEAGRRRSVRLQAISESSPTHMRSGSSRWCLRPPKPATSSPGAAKPNRRYDSVGNSSDESEHCDAIFTVDVNRRTAHQQEKMSISPGRLSFDNSTVCKPSYSSSEGSDSDEGDDGWMRRQLELSSLKEKWQSQRKEQKEDGLRRARDERLHMQAQRRREKEKREKEKEERRQLKVQERLLKQEELRRLLEEKKQQRIAERLSKEDELKKLKEQKREEKRRLQTALSVSLTNPNLASSPRSEKAANQSEHDLPLFPAFTSPIQGSVEQVLEVMVFVNCFKDVLGIPGFQDIGAVCLMLQTGAGLTELCSSLLKLVLPTEHHCQELSQEDLASNMCHTMVTECVTEAVRDERAPPLLLDCVPPKTVADRLHVLEFLFHEALATDVVVQCISSTADSVRKMRVEQRQWEQQRVKEISNHLMQMNDDKCSLEDLTQMREKCLEEVKEKKRKAALSLWLARSSLRVTPLGKDRHGRLYWQLPHVTGVVVEDGGEGGAQWYHISTLETFQELMASLNVMDDNELELLENLAQMQEHITSTLAS